MSVLGAVLANRVAGNIASGLAAAGIPAAAGGASAGTLDIAAMPPAMQSIVHVAYGDATALMFLIAAFIGVVGVHRRARAAEDPAAHHAGRRDPGRGHGQK